MEKLYALTRQFIKFGIVGVSNTAISLAIYYIFIFIDKDLYLAGNCIGFVVSVLNSYYWNNKYVFKNRNGSHIKAICRMFMSYGVSFVIGTILLIIFVKVLLIPEEIAPIPIMIISVPINFILNKYWTFK